MELTQEQLQAKAAHDNDLMTQVITAPTQAARMAAARELKMLSPVGQDPIESRVVISMMRTPDGRYWGCIQGGDGPVSQSIHATPREMMATLGAAAGLALNPLLNDEEHAALAKEIQQAAGN